MVDFTCRRLAFAELPGLEPDGRTPIDGGPFEILVTGFRHNGKTVTAIVPVENFRTLTPFAFQGFRNLISVHWFQGPGGELGPTHQFDDVVVAAPIPEPTVFALVIIGTLGVGVRHRVRRHFTATPVD